MGMVCFREKDKIDAFNSRIVESVNRSGRAYLNQTKLRGKTVIRLGLGNILTTEKHLRDAWELIQETARSLATPFRKQASVLTGPRVAGILHYRFRHRT